MEKTAESLRALLKKMRINFFADAADGLILSLLAFSFIGYSVYYKKFAEIHISIPGLDFPFFIGEIILAACMAVLLLKWFFIRKKFTRIYIFILLYIFLVLLKAFTGYFLFGPLAFRHAAIFYYPFFALIAYEAYNTKFISARILLPLLYIFCFIGICSYYNFVYLALSVILIMHLKVWISKLLCICILFCLPGFMFLIHCGRTQLVGHIAALLTIALFFFLTLKIKKAHKIILFLLLVMCACALLLKYGRAKDIKSLTTPQAVFARFKAWDLFIESRKNFVGVKSTSVRLYNPEEHGGIKKPDPAPLVDISQNQRFDNCVFLRGRPAMPVKLPQDKNKRKEIIDFIKSKGGSVVKRDTVKLIPLYSANSNRGPVYNNEFVLLPTNDKSIDETIGFIRKEGIYSSVAPNFLESEDNRLEQRYNTIIFRLLIWRDMLRELIENKKVFGMPFGKPLLPASLVISRMAYSEWARDGWIMAHNTYLELLYRSGIIGIVLLIVLFALLFKMFRVFLRARSMPGILLLSISFYWLGVGSIFVTFEMPYTAICFWSIFGVTLAYARNIVAARSEEKE